MSINSKIQDFNNVISCYIQKASVLEIKQLEAGNINKTYLVKYLKDNHINRLVLQNVNQHVFANPYALIENYLSLQTFLSSQLNTYNFNRERISIPRILINRNKKYEFISSNGSFWRAFEYIKESENFDVISSPKKIYNIGYALGEFHCLFKDLSGEKLKRNIDNFHQLSFYLDRFDSLSSNINLILTQMTKKNSLFEEALYFIKDNRLDYENLYSRIKKLNLTKSIIHADPKLSNFLFKSNSDDVISIIDMDTICCDYLLFDIADSLRSSCNLLGEENKDLDSISFDLFFYEQYLKGYLLKTLHILPKSDLFMIPNFLSLITFELGIRFFNDYVEGDRYFSINYPLNNLYRSIVQFRLLDDIQRKNHLLLSIIEKLNK